MRRRALRLFALVLPLAASSHGLACRGAPTPAEALRLGFPDHAAEVLERGGALVASAGGFAGTLRGGLVASLPRDGAQPIVLRAPGGFEVRVRERGLAAPGVVQGNAVAYARPEGGSFWSASAAGLEEWIALEAGAATAGPPAVAWHVDGATLRQAGQAVELCDAAGRARIRVTAPVAYTSSGERVPVRLSVRGEEVAAIVDAGGEAVLIDPVWASAASMITARENHTATTLMDGRVLVAGGTSGGAPTATAEIYDPTAGTWTAASPMHTARTNHAASLVAFGLVIVTGGDGGAGPIASAEIYDPSTDTWKVLSPMKTAREHHTATWLPTSLVLMVAGGTGAFSLKSAELYDASTDTWSPAANMGTGRSFHTATRLADGTVLVAGGYAGAASAELYDPVANTWTPTGAMTAARTAHSATLLADGTVLVAGGFGSLASAELYDPTTKSWAAVGPMATGRYAHTATALMGGNVLVTGGDSAGPAALPSVELYDVATKTWASGSPLADARAGHTASRLPDGSVLEAGGDAGGTALASTEVYTALAQGAACTGGGDCASGFCVEGVCCDQACGGGGTGSCSVCTKALGAPMDGTCTPLDGTPCDDGDACTQTDTCKMGTCVGSNPVTCTAPDSCHLAGACDKTTGQCSAPATKPNGAVCDPGTKCVTDATCMNAICVGAAVPCSPMDECHMAGTCDATTGACSNPEAFDGTPCSIGTCQKGVCTAVPMSSAAGAGGARSSSSSGAGGSSHGSSGGGCGCSVDRDRGSEGLWGLAVLALLGARRRRAPRRSASAPATSS